MKRWIVCAAAALVLAACGGSGDPVEEVPPLTALAVLDVPATAVAYEAGTLVLARTGEVTLWTTADLRAPKQVGRIEGTFALGDNTQMDQFTSLALAGKVLAVSRVPGCVGTCQPAEGQVELYDVSQPEQPRRLSTIAGAVFQLRIDAGRLYLLRKGDLLSGSSAGTLTIVDIGTPAAPVTLSTTVVANARTMDQRGDRLYLPFAEYAGSGSGLQVLDVADAAAPRVLSTVDRPFTEAGAADAAVDASQAYWVNGGTSVRRFDTAAAVERTPIVLPDAAHGVASDGQRLYVAGAAGVSVFDAAAAPSSAVVVATPHAAASVDLFGPVGVIVTQAVTSCVSPADCTVEPKVVLFATPQ